MIDTLSVTCCISSLEDMIVNNFVVRLFLVKVTIDFLLGVVEHSIHMFHLIAPNIL